MFEKVMKVYQDVQGEIVRTGRNPQSVKLSVPYVLYRLLALLGQDPVHEEITTSLRSTETLRVNESIWNTVIGELQWQPPVKV